MFGGHRILGSSIPAGKLTTAAMTEVLQQQALIVPYTKNAVAAPANGASTFTVADATAPSSGALVNGIVQATVETTKKYANIGILAANGDRIMSANARPLFGRVTSVTGAGPYTYTVTLYDDADQDTSTPTAATWNTGTMGATIGEVELPLRRRLADLGQTDLRTQFVGLNATERDVELLDDVAELYSKAGITEGSANNYAFNNYVIDGDTLLVGIGKLDNALAALAATVASNGSGATTRINELFSKTGITEGAANNYAFNFYVADSDTLLVAVGKLDNALNSINTRVTALETYQSTTGVRYTNVIPTGTIGGNVTFTLPAAPKVVSTRAQLDLYVQTLRAVEGVHFTIAGATITFIGGYEPIAGEALIADFWA